MEILDHWITEARQVKSPNYDERPVGGDISLIVVHCISLPPGQFGGDAVSKLFTNCLDPKDHPYFKEIHQLKVSAHVFIRRDGAIIQFVPFHKRAWHAGRSSYRGRSRCNDFSIGIELEGTEQMAYTEEQYMQLVLLIRTLEGKYPDLSVDRIAGHSDIAPQRKSDPGNFFDWKILHTMLNRM